MTETLLSFPAWMVFRRDPQITDWIVHTLEVDLISQGPTLPQARHNALAGLDVVAESDIKAGRHPLERRAKREFYLDMQRMLLGAQPATLAEADAEEEEVHLVVVQTVYSVVVTDRSRAKFATELLAPGVDPLCWVRRVLLADTLH